MIKHGTFRLLAAFKVCSPFRKLSPLLWMTGRALREFYDRWDQAEELCKNRHVNMTLNPVIRATHFRDIHELYIPRILG